MSFTYNSVKAKWKMLKLPKLIQCDGTFHVANHVFCVAFVLEWNVAFWISITHLVCFNCVATRLIPTLKKEVWPLTNINLWSTIFNLHVKKFTPETKSLTKADTNVFLRLHTTKPLKESQHTMSTNNLRISKQFQLGQDICNSEINQYTLSVTSPSSKLYWCVFHWE